MAAQLLPRTPDYILPHRGQAAQQGAGAATRPPVRPPVRARQTSVVRERGRALDAGVLRPEVGGQVAPTAASGEGLGEAVQQVRVRKGPLLLFFGFVHAAFEAVAGLLQEGLVLVDGHFEGLEGVGGGVSPLLGGGLRGSGARLGALAFGFGGGVVHGDLDMGIRGLTVLPSYLICGYN